MADWCNLVSAGVFLEYPVYAAGISCNKTVAGVAARHTGYNGFNTVLHFRSIPTNADIGGFAILFVYAGYLFSKVQIWEKKKLPVVCWLLAAVVYVCAAHIGGINMVIRYVPNYAAIPGALAGSLLLIKLSTYMEHWKKCAKILIWYGRNSMKILCVHLFEMMIIPWGYFAQWLGLADTRLTTIVLRTLFITIGVLIINGIVRGVKKIQTF